MGVFWQNLGIRACTLENYSNLNKFSKVNFHSTMGIFLRYMIILELGEMPDLMTCLN